MTAEVAAYGGKMVARRRIPTETAPLLWLLPLDEPKTPRSRRVVLLAQPVVAALRRHRTRQLTERLAVGPAWSEEWGELIFSSESGAPLHGTSVAKRFRAIMRRAGMPGLVPPPPARRRLVDGRAGRAAARRNVKSWATPTSRPR